MVEYLFVIWLNLNIQNGAINSGISAGIESQEFKLADELNNKIIKSVNNELKDFRHYVRQLNKEAKHKLRMITCLSVELILTMN